MATNRFVGEAVAVAQVDTFTPASITIDDVFTLTATGWDGVVEVLTYTAVDTSAGTVSLALIALWNASTSTACTGVTASGSATVILTADVAGVAFTVASSATGTIPPTLARVATTKNEGPSDWTSLANWSLGVVPVAADDVYIEGAFTILYGLAQSAVTLDSLNTSGARIGTNPVAGWRPVSLAIGWTIAEIGYHYGPSKVTQLYPINLDVGETVDAAITIHNSGNNGTMPAVRLTCKDDGDRLVIRKGSVGLYNNSSGDAQLATIAMDYITNKAGDVDLFIEPGWTIATINKNGGHLLLQTLIGKTIATMNINGIGTVLTEGDGPITTINHKAGAGTSVLNSTGTVASIVIDGGLVDMTKSSAARTVDAVKLNAGTFKRGSAVTVTAWTAPDNPVTLTASAA